MILPNNSVLGRALSAFNLEGLFSEATNGHCMSDIARVKQDDTRYNATRGAHLNLKRAEKARVLVNKIPGMQIVNIPIYLLMLVDVCQR